MTNRWSVGAAWAVTTGMMLVLCAPADAQEADDGTPRNEIEVFMGGGFVFADEFSSVSLDGGVTAWRGHQGVGAWATALPATGGDDGAVTPAFRRRYSLGDSGFWHYGVGYLHLLFGHWSGEGPLYWAPYGEMMFGRRFEHGAWSIGLRAGGPAALQVVVLARMFRGGGGRR